MAKTTKIEMTEGLHLWSSGVHTVSSLEVQAIKLWAAGFSEAMCSVPARSPSEANDKGLLAGLLKGAANEGDGRIAAMLLRYKELEAQAGRIVMSMDPVRH